jgi:hypothetical protein
MTAEKGSRNFSRPPLRRQPRSRTPDDACSRRRRRRGGGDALFVIAGIGGYEIEIGELAIRARDWLRPALALALALAARSALGVVGVSAQKVSSSAVVSGVVTRSLLAMIVASGIVYSQYHVRVAGGLDSYGYVSAATSIVSGRLREPQPLAAVLPFADSLSAATPLGQVPATDGRSSVPRFPLGLPIMMALFALFHQNGPFFVPLVMACVALALVYAIGRTSSDRVTGLFAAALVAVDPVFAVSAIQPMSDVPAACWLLAAIWAEKAQPRLWSVASGVCAGMAVLTRPVLLPAMVVFLLVTMTRSRLGDALTRAGVVLVFLLLQLSLNASLYGTATMSGYGATSHMFELSGSRLGANLSNFAKWAVYSGAPPFWFLWPAALGVLWRDRRAWEASAVGAAAAAPYLFIWSSTTGDASRFLLPTIVLASIVCARAVSHISARRPSERGGRRSICDRPRNCRRF